MGYIGLIKNIVRMIKNQTGKNFKIILTEGCRIYLKTSIDMKNSVDKDLNHQGINEFIEIKRMKDELLFCPLGGSGEISEYEFIYLWVMRRIENGYCGHGSYFRR